MFDRYDLIRLRNNVDIIDDPTDIYLLNFGISENDYKLFVSYSNSRDYQYIPKTRTNVIAYVVYSVMIVFNGTNYTYDGIIESIGIIRNFLAAKYNIE